MRTQPVITYQNVHTQEVANLCEKHDDMLGSSVQVQHGRHDGICDYCAMAAHMGARGGRARAASLSTERRQEIARLAGSAPKKPRAKVTR